MKRAIIGGFISLIGSILLAAFSISATSMMINGWSTPPGKFLTAIAEANVSFGFWLSFMLIVLEYVSKFMFANNHASKMRIQPR